MTPATEQMGVCEMSEETRDMLLEQLKGTRESLNELWERIDAEGVVTYTTVSPVVLTDDPAMPLAWATDEHESRTEIIGDDSEDAREELNDLPLEIVWEVGEPFAVVLGTGGPHVEIRGGTRHDGSGYALHGYWGGEHVTISGESITRTGEYFRELVEES